MPCSCKPVACSCTEVFCIASCMMISSDVVLYMCNHIAWKIGLEGTTTVKGSVRSATTCLSGFSNANLFLQGTSWAAYICVVPWMFGCKNASRNGGKCCTHLKSQSVCSIIYCTCIWASCLNNGSTDKITCQVVGMSTASWCFPIKYC